MKSTQIDSKDTVVWQGIVADTEILIKDILISTLSFLAPTGVLGSQSQMSVRPTGHLSVRPSVKVV